MNSDDNQPQLQFGDTSILEKMRRERELKKEAHDAFFRLRACHICHGSGKDQKELEIFKKRYPNYRVKR